jgi:hypothetical protein
MPSASSNASVTGFGAAGAPARVGVSTMQSTINVRALRFF